MDVEARAELLALTRALRQNLEWHAETGSAGLPPSAAADFASAVPEPRPGAAVTAGAEPARGSVAPAPSAAPAPSPAPARPAAERPRTSPALSAALQSALAAPAPEVPADPEARRIRLSVLADEIRGCTRCGLFRARRNTVFARGTGSSGLCFVGEGPGADEDAQGFPFVGAAGQLLDKMIAAMGLGRDEVYVCNIVKCRPPDNRKPDPDEMAACVPYLREQLELVEPQVIVALGATAVQGLLGTTDGITRLRGKWKLYRGRVAVMPTFHPAYLLRNPAAKRDVWDDLRAVLKQLGRPVPGPPSRG